MTTSEVLRRVWHQLEEESEHLPGLYQRRVFPNSGHELFAGLVRPGMHVRLTLGVRSASGTASLERETRGFRVLRQFDPATRTTNVILELVQTSFREIFEVMSEDIASRIVAATDEVGAVGAFLERLNRWDRFMSAVGSDGLSREDQVGLFGELTFLLTLLSSRIAAGDAVQWWLGPKAANQDFQHGNRAVEVKAATGNSSTVITISNELQLDDSDCEQLRLFHLWLKQVERGGTSLPDLVDRISALLTGSAAELFADRLVESGYHDVHRARYEGTGYLERHRQYYRVEGAFPRIRRADLPSGVTRVRYCIDLAGSSSFRDAQEDVIRLLAGSPA